MVKLTKQALRPTLHGKSVKFDELRTILCELSAAINRRPLTEMSASTHEKMPIRPEDFLFGARPANWKNPVEPLETEDDAGLGLDLWERWRKEYLHSLRKWRSAEKACKPPQVNEVVLIRQPTPRGTWPLGRVLQLLPGKDGLIRTAKIICKGRKTVRAITQLIPLARKQSAQAPKLSNRAFSQSTPPINQPYLDISSDGLGDFPRFSRAGRELRRPKRFITRAPRES